MSSVPQVTIDGDQIAKFEGGIREVLRRADEAPPRQRTEGNLAAEAAENLNGLIQRIAGASAEEIDRVIFELQGVRDMLGSEGERVSQEVAGYAKLNHAAITAMKVIDENLTKWKDRGQTNR